MGFGVGLQLGLEGYGYGCGYGYRYGYGINPNPNHEHNHDHNHTPYRGMAAPEAELPHSWLNMSDYGYIRKAAPYVYPHGLMIDRV